MPYCTMDSSTRPSSRSVTPLMMYAPADEGESRMDAV